MILLKKPQAMYSELKYYGCRMMHAGLDESNVPSPPSHLLLLSSSMVPSPIISTAGQPTDRAVLDRAGHGRPVVHGKASRAGRSRLYQHFAARNQSLED
jgi:hypothetical protein